MICNIIFINIKYFLWSSCFLEPERMLSTVQKDFVPLNSRKQELSPSQLQQVKYWHFTADKLQLTGFPFILLSMKSKHRHWPVFTLSWAVWWALALLVVLKFGYNHVVRIPSSRSLFLNDEYRLLSSSVVDGYYLSHRRRMYMLVGHRL